MKCECVDMLWDELLSSFPLRKVVVIEARILELVI